MSSQLVEFDAEEELQSEEDVKAEVVEEDVDEEITAAETRSLLESPDGSIAHADLGLFTKYH